MSSEKMVQEPRRSDRDLQVAPYKRSQESVTESHCEMIWLMFLEAKYGIYKL